MNKCHMLQQVTVTEDRNIKGSSVSAFDKPWWMIIDHDKYFDKEWDGTITVKTTFWEYGEDQIIIGEIEIGEVEYTYDQWVYALEQTAKAARCPECASTGKLVSVEIVKAE